MGDDFADRLAREVPEWVEEGIVSEEQADRLLDRYEADAGSRSLAETLDAGGFEPALYATAAVLLGAAAIAFVVVGLDPADAGAPLAGAGLVLAGLGAALHVVEPEADRVADVLLAASLAPLAAAALPFTDPAWAPRLAALAAPVGLLAWRHERAWVGQLAAVAFPVAAGGTAFSQYEYQDPSTASWFFAGVQSLFLAGLVARDRLVLDRDHAPTVALGVAGFAVAAGFFLEIVVDVGSSEQLEVALGGVMLVLILAGLAIAHRGLVAGAGAVLAGDAIVFAFDFGGTFGGTLLLLGLAVLLVWQAETIRQAVG